MKKILVPCDFSNTAVQAFRFACQLASVSKGEVFVLHVIELPNLHSSKLVPIQAYEKAFLKQLKSKVQANFEKLKERWGGKLKIHLSLEHGPVADGIRKFTDRKRIDLIVMGTHGASGIREFTVGSNTEKIVRSSRVPVFAIKKLVNVASIKNIIFPTNLVGMNKTWISSLQALQQLLRAKLHILYVNVPSNFTPDHVSEVRLIEFAHDYQFKNCDIHIYNDIDEESGILNFSKKIKHTIIAMATHGRTGINHLMSGSIAEDVVNHIEGPIWTLSEK